MYVVVIHRFRNPQVAFARGEKLVKNIDAPAGARGLEFYPAKDASTATCLWEGPSVQAIQEYVDSTLGDSSENTCFEVDAAHSFAERPDGIPTPAAVRG